MEWIQRNPKKAVGLSALAVLVVIMVVWGMSGGSGSPSAEPTLGGPSLATPTATPSHKLTALSSPSATAVPTTQSALMAALENGGGSATSTAFGHGSSSHLAHHNVVVRAGSDSEMMAVGWWIPFADGERKGGDGSKPRTFRHADSTWGDPGTLARILAYSGPFSKKTWCTITVDGKVTERQEAPGPYAQVFCQG
jgi:hypothetical protein